MAIEVMTLVYAARFGAVAAKAVALKLADYANKDGTGIFPAENTIAFETEVTKRTVDKYMNLWLVLGILRIDELGGGVRTSQDRRRFRLGAGRTTVYALDVKILRAMADGAVTMEELTEDAIGKGMVTESGEACPLALATIRETAKGAATAPIKGAPAAPLKDAPAAPLAAGKGCNPRKERVQLAHEKGAVAAPEPLLNRHGTTHTHTTTGASGTTAPGASGSERERVCVRFDLDLDRWDLRVVDQFIGPLERALDVRQKHVDCMAALVQELAKYSSKTLSQGAASLRRTRSVFPTIAQAVAACDEANKDSFRAATLVKGGTAWRAWRDHLTRQGSTAGIKVMDRHSETSVDGNLLDDVLATAEGSAS